MNAEIISGHLEVVDKTTTYSINDVCERCGVPKAFVVELVEYGIIAPLSNQSAQQWAFDTRALMRLRRAHRLQRDLKINLPGLALSLELLDNMRQLRRRVNSLDQQLQQLLEHGD